MCNGHFLLLTRTSTDLHVTSCLILHLSTAVNSWCVKVLCFHLMPSKHRKGTITCLQTTMAKVLLNNTNKFRLKSVTKLQSTVYTLDNKVCSSVKTISKGRMLTYIIDTYIVSPKAIVHTSYALMDIPRISCVHTHTYMYTRHPLPHTSSNSSC